MLGPAAADVEQRQDQQAEPAAAVVAPQPAERLAQPPRQIDARRYRRSSSSPPYEVSCLRDELDGQIALDHPSQARYAQPHQRGLQCGGSERWPVLP